MRRAAAAAAILAGLAALAWGAGIVHARWRVGRAVARLREDHLEAVEPGSFVARGVPSAQEVAALGCRALPALVAELDPRLSSYYLCRVGECLSTASDGEAPRVVFGEDPAARAEAVAVVRGWWTKEGAAHHQWWRFWSSRCRPLVR